MQKLVILLGLSVLWVGCKGEPLPDGDSAGFETAFNEGDAKALGEIYAEDAVLLPPGAPPVVGRDAIVKGFEEAFANKLVMKADYTETASAGDLGYKQGTYTMSDVNQVQIDDGKFLEVWKREADGWKLYRDAFSGNAPPPPVPLSDADTESIQATLQNIAEALESDDLATWGAQYAEDALFLPPNAPMVKGRAAIVEFGKSFPKVRSVSFGDVEIKGKGDTAILTSTVSATLVEGATEGAPDDSIPEGAVDQADTDAATTDSTSKQLMVFTKQIDGTWVISYVAFNSVAPPAEATDAKAAD